VRSRVRNPFYLPSLAAALVLGIVVAIVRDPSFDRHHRAAALYLSVLILSANVAVLMAYPITRTIFVGMMVKDLGMASMFCILLLAITHQPNFEVKGIFTAVDSKLKP